MDEQGYSGLIEYKQGGCAGLMKEPQTKRNTQAVGCIKPLSFTSVRVRGCRSGRGGSGKGGPVAEGV